MKIVLATMFESGFLKWFAENRDLEDWSETAASWLIAALVVSVLIAGLMFAYKALRKYLAPNIKDKIWSRGQTIMFMLVGLLPVLLAIWIIWYTTRDFVNIVGVTGLLKGVAFSWLFYLFIMIVGHLASPWRREII